MRIKAGTNRLVFVFDDLVFKIPYRTRGLRANQQEYENALNNQYVSKTYKLGFINIQERLSDIVVLPLDTKEENVPAEFKELWKHKLNNRFQVGKDKSGKYKFFDYEDVKFYESK